MAAVVNYGSDPEAPVCGRIPTDTGARTACRRLKNVRASVLSARIRDADWFWIRCLGRRYHVSCATSGILRAEPAAC